MANKLAKRNLLSLVYPRRGGEAMKTKNSKKFTLAIVVIVMAGFIWGYGFENETAAKAPTPVDSNVQMVPMNFAQLAKTVKPGVVNIRTVKTMKGGGPVFRHFFGNPFGPQNPRGEKDPFHEFFGPFSERGPSRDFKQRSLGSGFIISKDGYIVTNNHVIDNADEIKVKLADGKEYDAKLVGRDPNTDLALIKIKGSSDLVPLEMGDSDNLDVGSWVVAIGSPFGLEQTVTAGIVSAKGRVIGAGPYDNFIQTDASINPGNSGGPLLNMNGEVVGINTAIVAQGQGIGFAIPVKMAQGIIAQLKDHGSVTRGWLGVGIQDLTPELAEYYGMKDKKGVLVSQVFKGDPAEKAGVKSNDIIIAVDGKPVNTSRELSATIAGLEVGKRTAITVVRNGKEETFYAELAKRQDADLVARQELEDNGDLGMQVTELTPEAARRFGHAEDEKGILVVGVQPGSKADAAGIQQGDLLKEVNRKPVDSLKSLTSELKDKSGDSVQFLVKRPNAGFLVITIS
jgi:serine protease Do